MSQVLDNFVDEFGWWSEIWHFSTFRKSGHVVSVILCKTRNTREIEERKGYKNRKEKTLL